MDHATRSPLVATWWRTLALAALTAATLGIGAAAASSASAEWATS